MMADETGGMELLLLIICLSAAGGFIAGTVLFGRGVRGRRLDRHPVCRRCKYDLMGIPHFSPRCPECGSILLSTTVVIGNRRRRGRLILVGLSMMLVIGSLTASTLYSSVATDFARYRPIWWLRAELNSPVPYGRRSADEELAGKLLRGDLDAATASSIADTAIDRLDNTAFLEAFDSRKGLSAAQLDRLSQRVVRATFAVSATSESQIHFTVTLPHRELGMCEEPRGVWSPVITHVELDGIPTKPKLPPFPSRPWAETFGDLDLDVTAVSHTHDVTVTGSAYWITPRGGCIVVPFKLRRQISLKP